MTENARLLRETKNIERSMKDMVDTVTWTGGSSSGEGGVGLTGIHTAENGWLAKGILKVCLESVVRRFDRRYRQ